MKSFDKTLRKGSADKMQEKDNALLFLFFLLGLGAVLLGNHFFPQLSLLAGERVLPSFLLLPAACALLAGSTVFGLYVIPSTAFLFGCLLAVLSYRFCSTAADDTQLLAAVLFGVIASPTFFMIGKLGLQNASTLLHALHLSGKRMEKEVIKCFFIRWMIFAVLLLCFLSYNSNLYT